MSKAITWAIRYVGPGAEVNGFSYVCPMECSTGYGYCCPCKETKQFKTEADAKTYRDKKGMHAPFHKVIDSETAAKEKAAKKKKK